MAASVDDVLAQALALQVNDRAALLERLAESLDRPDGVLDQQWLDEAHRRMQAFSRGEMRAIDAEAVWEEVGATSGR